MKLLGLTATADKDLIGPESNVFMNFDLTVSNSKIDT